ncbi:hypothetical protein B5V01_32315 [Mesorhizobium erdmanii]|uniref:Uncharacterized protein n=2 Tax=Mesorhizobium TaxID=68287 RepID=A0A3M9XHK1_9HYPH|nr:MULTISPECIES: hypothetical protein [Mesorhizobium]RNJ47222.1 hypothetical protein DNR46_05130 [Mesorhizobium japonicum]RXT33773.1 hypothetical protein B5V01_32315 [Mesorhizobium erdmanii]
MIEFVNSDGLTSSLNPRNLVQLLYVDRHTSKSGTSIICSNWSDETAETAEVIAARIMTQARIVTFRLFVGGKASIPTWFNADAIVEVHETKTGHCAIIAENGTFTLVAETYQQVLAALAAATVILSS